MTRRIFKSKFLSVLLILTLVLPCLITTPVMAAESYPHTASNFGVSTATNTTTTTPVSVAVRIEGQSNTIWSGTVTVSNSTITDSAGTQHILSQPTVLGALDAASKAGGFPYVVENSSNGLYIYSINGENPAGSSGWMYWVDGYSPMVGAADFILDRRHHHLHQTRKSSLPMAGIIADGNRILH